MIKELVPTLNFNGDCREAITLYEKAFEGHINCLITYEDSQDPQYMPLLRKDQYGYIYHAELQLGEQRIIMSDHVDMEFTTCYTNFITIMFYDKEEVERAYSYLKEGSTTIYPLEETPYSTARVVFVDRFGIRWGIMTEK